MSDEADRADVDIENALRESMYRASLTTHREATGCCYNCERTLVKPQLYCDEECETEHRWYLERTR